MELDTDTFQTVSEDLTYSVEVPGKLVHIGGRNMTRVMEPDMRHTKTAEHLPKIGGDARLVFGASVRSGNYQIIVVIDLTGGIHEPFLLNPFC